MKPFYCLTIALFFLFHTSNLTAQSSRIGSNEVEYVQQQSKNMVATLEQLLNLIGDKNTSSQERSEFTEESYKLIIYDENVVFEDDLIQERDRTRTIKVKEYLKNVYLYFKNSGVKFAYKNITISEVFEKEYMFVLVFFDRDISGDSVYHNERIENTVGRVAEIKMTPNEGQWDLHIVGLRFPTKEDLARSYDKAEVFESDSPFKATNTSELEDLNGRLVQANKAKEEYENHILANSKDCIENLKNKEKEIAILEVEIEKLSTEKSSKEEELRKMFADVNYENRLLREEMEELKVIEKTFKKLEDENAVLEQNLDKAAKVVEGLEAALETEKAKTYCYLTNGEKTVAIEMKGSQINLPVKFNKIQLISDHPLESYSLERTDDKQALFAIEDLSYFWSLNPNHKAILFQASLSDSDLERMMD